MIRKILEFLDNRQSIKEMEKEYTQMREVLIFNMNNADILIDDIREILDNNDLYYDKKTKIIELLDDYQSVK